MKKVTFSQSFDRLSQELVRELEQRQSSPFEESYILVPSSSMESWLSVKLAQYAKGKALAAYQIYTLSQWREKVMQGAPSFETIFFTLYQELKILDSAEVKHYLNDKLDRIPALVEHITPFFSEYLNHAETISLQSWQHTLLQKGIDQKLLPSPALFFQKNIPFLDKIYCFGFDFLPPTYWKYLFSHANVFCYLFSPCLFFWQDICNSSEKRWLSKKYGENAEELFSYLEEAPSLLANLSKVGRETLKTLDLFELETVEAYAETSPQSLLEQVQHLLLHFQTKAEIPFPKDDSIEVFMTGTSMYREVEVIGEKILSLQKKGIPFSEMLLLCPDLNNYAPLLELIFSSFQIPYRIMGVEMGTKSLALQAFFRLLTLLHDAWEENTLVELFESPSFYQKIELDVRGVLLSKKWIKTALRENGIDALLEDWIYFSEEGMEMGDTKRLEAFLAAFCSLQRKRGGPEKTLTEWADFFREIFVEFIEIDPRRESDALIENKLFSFLKNLKHKEEIFPQTLFPLELLLPLLKKPFLGQIHSSELHSLKISEISQGALESKQAIFLLGMDMESFPQVPSFSSLNLLPKGLSPDKSDLDRYFFLQALFSAGKHLIFSYGHLSRQEGKPIGPSKLLLELFEFIDSSFGQNSSALLQKERLEDARAPFPKIKEVFKAPVEEEVTELVAIRDLLTLAKHPWNFFLQKKYGIFLKTPLEPSFSLEKSRFFQREMGLFSSKESLFEGAIARAIEKEAKEELLLRQEFLKEHQIEAPFSLFFLESCREKRECEGGFEHPPLTFSFGKKTVKVVGELTPLSNCGCISLGGDDLDSLLKVWPKWLLAALALEKGELFCLKTKKVRSLTEPKKWFEAYLRYFFLAAKTPAPLIPGWITPLLKEGELEKKRGRFFEDPIYDWVDQRFEIPSLTETKEAWGKILDETFQGLTLCFRKKHAKI